jgi:hypothetical protein
MWSDTRVPTLGSSFETKEGRPPPTVGIPLSSYGAKRTVMTRTTMETLWQPRDSQSSGWWFFVGYLTTLSVSRPYWVEWQYDYEYGAVGVMRICRGNPSTTSSTTNPTCLACHQTRGGDYNDVGCLVTLHVWGSGGITPRIFNLGTR